MARCSAFLQQDPAQWLGYDVQNDDADLSAEIDALLQEREQARRDKNFQRSDDIRDQLQARGIEIEDTPDGPIWKKVG